MPLPQPLTDAAGRILESCDPRVLADAAARLSDAYRAPETRGTAFVMHTADAQAYLAVRLPATYAALHAVFNETAIRVTTPLSDLLDLGAGPGTAAWAGTDVFPSLARITAFERSNAFLQLGTELGVPAGAAVSWEKRDVTVAEPLPPHDLVVSSYMLNELNEQKRCDVVQRAWAAARTALVIVEPGTMAGFGVVRQARDELIRAGAYIAAPCPHADTCPMDKNDWCHFAARLPRTALHRRLKGGRLEYEDEKFAYVVATKEPVERCSSRILRHPQRHGGHAGLRLCTPGGVEDVTVTRSDKKAWKKVRKAGWGNEW